MSFDVRVLFLDGERAARRGEIAAARGCFLDAAQAAAEVQLWRSALRCYRHVLELDLLDRGVVDRALQLPPRVLANRGWDRYRAALDAHAGWRPFSCRAAQIVSGDLGAVIECPGVGPVLELIMSAHDLCSSAAAAAPCSAGSPHRPGSTPGSSSSIATRRIRWPSRRSPALADRQWNETVAVTR